MSDSAFHVVILGSTTNAKFGEKSNDVGDYAKILIAGLRASSEHFEIVSSHYIDICHDREGYFVKYLDRGAEPIAASVELAVSGTTAYTAIYERDLETPDLPAARAAISSLCPPLPDHDQ